MDGVHDLGGKPGFGVVDKTGDEEVFHDRWEAIVFAMLNASASAGAFYSSDRFRHAIERIDPEAYLTHGYYGRWLGGLENLLVEAGVITQEEITQRAVRRGGAELDLIAARPATDPDPLGPLPLEPGCKRTVSAEPIFKVGDRVITRANAVDSHTRLPAYARGKSGAIVAAHDGWVFPDTNAHGKGEHPQHLYTVKFSSQELWNRPGFSVCIDLFEPYVERSP